ncbi:hypothetical protein R1sor_014578 [Riccia sorocarpa]|uniref:Uncharacterized protein n=1 Tax=Riccia sorocarpa TaxID=122646 RepID=A0ABD3HDN2_9MARC
MAPFTSRDKKKAKRDPSPGSPEAGELTPIVPPSESSKTKKTKSGPKTTIDERDERKRENAIIRHAWFKWFASQANLTPMTKLYWTLGADEGRKRFENKLVELGTETFAHLSLDPNAPLFSHYTLDVQTRLRKAGPYGTVYKNGVVVSSLVADLGSHEVVFYVTKLLNDDAAVGKRRYNHLDKAPQKWTAPELTEEKAYTGDERKQYITYWTKSTDVFAMGWLIKEICGDFFIDMSREEKLEYDREKWAMGYPTTSEPLHQTYRLRLKEALDAMVYLNISSLRDHRKTAEYWAHYFIDQLMVDPTICMRPIESTKRAAKHPDGPRDIKENKW